MAIHMIDIFAGKKIDYYMSSTDGYDMGRSLIYIKEVLKFFTNPEYSHLMKDWLLYINKNYPQYKSEIEKYLVLL
jgi:flavin reductase (DIM6/NTAB) family NADH-FMN oxidoreductase RutF